MNGSCQMNNQVHHRGSLPEEPDFDVYLKKEECRSQDGRPGTSGGDLPHPIGRPDGGLVPLQPMPNREYNYKLKKN